jgi:hypothetical protein
MDSRLALIQEAAKTVADSAHPVSTIMNDDIKNKLTAFKEGIKSTDPHLFSRAYITLGSKVFGSKINLGTKKAKPITVMKGMYDMPIVSNVSRLTNAIEHGWTKGKELHYQSFEEGPLAAYVTLVREMYELKNQFIKKKLLVLTPDENRVYDTIFNDSYLKTVSSLINKSDATTQQGLVKDFTTKGFDPRSDFIAEMVFRKFKNNASGYVKLIDAIAKVNAAAKPIYNISSSIAKNISVV